MSQVTEARTSHRMRTAAIVAGGVAAVLFVQDLIGNVSWLLVGYSQGEYNTGMYLGDLWQTLAYGILFLVAFAVGVGVSLWRIAPVAGELRPTAVVLRGLLATAVGAVLVVAVHLAFGLLGPLAGTGSLFGNSFPELPWGGIGQAASMAFQAGFRAFVEQGPVAVLVALLVWIWLGRHPSQHAVSADTASV